MPPGSIEKPIFVEEKFKSRIDKEFGSCSLKLNGKIMGMTISVDKLFVVCKTPPNIIFQYDIDTLEDMPSIASNRLIIEEMKWPRGIAASDHLSCLYITDWSNMFGGRLWRYDYRNDSSGFVDLDVQPFGVSYSSRNDLILVTCATPLNVVNRRGWIHIYDDCPWEFKKVQTVELESLEIPRHAVLTSKDVYLVCHGWNLTQHGVTAFQQNLAREIKTAAFYGSNFGGGSNELELKRPLSRTLDEDGLVLVVDYYNHRIQLLTEDLHLLRHLITKEEHQIEYPRHVCLHPKTKRLFVGQEDGRIHLFDAYL
jgi:hypothetical protein